MGSAIVATESGERTLARGIALVVPERDPGGAVRHPKLPAPQGPARLR